MPARPRHPEDRATQSGALTQPRKEGSDHRPCHRSPGGWCWAQCTLWNSDGALAGAIAARCGASVDHLRYLDSCRYRLELATCLHPLDCSSRQDSLSTAKSPSSPIPEYPRPYPPRPSFFSQISTTAMPSAPPAPSGACIRNLRLHRQLTVCEIP